MVVVVAAAAVGGSGISRSSCLNLQKSMTKTMKLTSSSSSGSSSSVGGSIGISSCGNSSDTMVTAALAVEE